MNVQRLHQHVESHLQYIRPAIDHVFLKTIHRVEQDPSTAINTKTFVSHLNKGIRHLGVRVTVRPTDEFPFDSNFYPPLNAWCYEPKKGKTARIQVIICTHTHHEPHRLRLTIQAWRYFQFRFLKTITHELVHRAQYAMGRRYDNAFIFRPQAAARMDKYMWTEQKYLGDMDEVEAYARDVVEEWYYMNPTTPLSLKSIKDDFRHNQTLPAIQRYHGPFLGDEDHLCVRRLFRKINDWNKVLNPLAATLPESPSYTRRPPKRILHEMQR